MSEPVRVGQVFQARTKSGRHWFVSRHTCYGWILNPLGPDAGHSGGGARRILIPEASLADPKKWTLLS